MFGLLCLIGRTAELAPREDERGRPLPMADTMGYKALSEQFGPLLIGALLDSYTMRLAHPNSGLVLLPLTPPKSRRDDRKAKWTEDVDPTAHEINKITIANQIAEMVITHWRDVVRHIRNLENLRRQQQDLAVDMSRRTTKALRPSVSENFSHRQHSLGQGQTRSVSVNTDALGSPMPRGVSFRSNKQPKQPRHPELMRELSHVLTHPEPYGVQLTTEKEHTPLYVKRKRPSASQATPENEPKGEASHTVLSPTVEESPLARKSTEPPCYRTVDVPTPISGEENQDFAQQGSTGETPVCRISIGDSPVLHSPVPQSPAHTSPILRASSHDLIRLDQTMPRVDFIAAIREPRGSHHGPPKRSSGSGSSRGSHHRGRGAHQGRMGSSSREQLISGTETPKWTVVDSHQNGGHGQGSPLGSLQSLDSTGSITRRGHGSSVPQTGAAQPATAQEPTPGSGTSRVRGESSFDSGYFPDNEEVVWPHPAGPHDDGDRTNDGDHQVQTNPALSSKPGLTFHEAPDQGQHENEDGSMHAMPNDGNQPLPQAPVPSSQGFRNLFPRGYIRDEVPLETPHVPGGYPSISEHSPVVPPPETPLVPGSFPQGMLKSSRISSSKPATGRHPSGPASTKTADGVPVQNETPQGVIAAGTEKASQAMEAIVNAASGVVDTMTGRDVHHDRPDRITARTPTQESNFTGGKFPSVSGPLSGVKAMAAMFETVWKNPEPKPLGTGRRTRSQSRPGLTTDDTQTNKRVLRRSTSVASGRPFEDQERSGSVTSTHKVVPDEGTVSAQNPTPENTHKPRTISISEAGLRPIPKPITTSQPTTPEPNQEEEHERLRMLTPGTMTPGIEQPPIARHVSTRRPARSETPTNSNDEYLPQRETQTQTPRTTAALHAQVRQLQRLLETKAEETMSLRRQLEAIEGGDGIGTLSERLRHAEREVKTWRERALTAEKRVAVFEKFLGRVRQLRDREKEKGMAMSRDAEEEFGEALDRVESEVGVGVGGDGQRSSDDSTRTEDGSVFQWRLRREVRAAAGMMDGVTSESDETEQDVYDEDEEEAAIFRAMQERDVGETEEEGDGDFSASLLMATREVLEYEDMKRWLVSSA